MKTILIIDSNERNWYEIFEEINRDDIQIEQTMWKNITLTSYSDTGAVLNVEKSFDAIEGTTQNRKRTVRPDFLLIRNVIRAALPSQDYRNTVYGLKYAGIPSINSLDSILLCSERPWVFGELLKINKRLGKESFPLINQTYYSHFSEMLITPNYPIVVKVGFAHAGYGKMCLQNHHDFEDLRSVMALYNDYITAEPFIDSEYDIRIQKIGNHYRAFKRIASGWKGNMTTSIIEDIPLSETYKLWIEECAKIFGGLDILAVDAIHAKDGQEYIIELNDSAIGLAPHTEEEDVKYIRDLILERL